MAFITILIALVIERFFDWSHIRRWRWFERNLAWFSRRFSAWPLSLVLAMVILPVVLMVVIANHLLVGLLYGILKLVFGVLVLMYCLGPVNFWAEAYQCLAAMQGDNPQVAMARAKAGFGIMVFDNPQLFHRAFTNALFAEANRRIFAVIFWFLLLGPAGALLYRVVDICRLSGVALARPAANLLALLDWLPVRIFTFLFALGGHFTKVIKHWQHDVLTPPKMNEVLLSECGIAALDILESERIPEDGSAEKETISLLDRVFVIAIVILAIVVLI